MVLYSQMVRPLFECFLQISIFPYSGAWRKVYEWVKDWLMAHTERALKTMFWLKTNQSYMKVAWWGITSSSLSKASFSFRWRSRANSHTCCHRAESWLIRGFFASDCERIGMGGGVGWFKDFPKWKNNHKIRNTGFITAYGNDCMLKAILLDCTLSLRLAYDMRYCLKIKKAIYMT